MSIDTMSPDASAVRRVSWGAILVGVVVALALMVFFTTLGLAIGTASVDPLYDRNPLSGLGVWSGIYLAVTQLIALGTGGFAAARLAGVPRTIASFLHGAAVWSLTTVFLTWAAASGTGAIFSAASSVLGNAASGVSNVTQAVIPDDVSFPDYSDVASRVSVEDLPPELQQVLEENDITIEQLRTEAREAFRNVVSQQEQQRAMSILREALSDAVRTPGDTRTDLDESLDSLIGGPDAVFSQEDREEVLSALESRLGITPEQTEQIVQSVEAQAQAAVDQLRQTLDQIQQQVLETAQAATSVVATTAIWLTIASLFGLLAAMGGAFAGKPDGMLGDRLDDHF